MPINPNVILVGRNTISTGLELKDLSYAVTKFRTTIELGENKKVVYVKDYAKLYGKVAAFTTHLCKTAGIEG